MGELTSSAKVNEDARNKIKNPNPKYKALRVKWSRISNAKWNPINNAKWNPINNAKVKERAR